MKRMGMMRGFGMMLGLAALVACGGDGGAGGSVAARGSDDPAPPRAESPGGKLFAGGCAPCHGARGQGTQIAPSLADSARTAETVARVVEAGVATAEPPHVPMPARGDGTWTDAQVRTVAEYVTSLAK
jgi:mono/diheme cytochrome c family protein